MKFVFANISLILMYVVFAALVSVVIWAEIQAFRKRSRSERFSFNNIPVRRIAVITVIATGLVLIVSYLLGSSAPMTINGKPYTTAIWLYSADIFIISTIVLLLMAVVALVYNYFTTKDDY